MSSVEILIADDHAAVRRGLRSLVEEHPGWRVCGEAADGAEAIEKAVQLHPQVVLMDITMPRVDGLDATRAILRDLPNTKVILVSQNDPAVVRWQATEVHATGFVAKTDLARELIPAIENACNGHSKREHTAASSNASGAVASTWLAGDGEIAERMRTMDWSRTPLGPMQHWPQSLKTSISICLASRFPIVMYWGPEYVVLYNEAYGAILGDKHPWALGQRCRDCWAEIWETIGPMLDGVVNSAQATWSDDLLLLLRRHGYPEECYFSFSFSPIRIESGEVGGVFTAVMETTEKVISQRRLRTLRDLAARAVDTSGEAEAWRIATQTLAENPQDIPFAVLYQFYGSNDEPRVLGNAGIERDHPLCTSLRASGSSLFKRLKQVTQSREPLEIEDLKELTDAVPHGAWQLQPESALLLPIAELGQAGGAGVLLAAVSPHKRLDESYRTFFQLVARQIATSVADARSFEQERKRAEALAELDRAKTLFFSNVSHEFRTPLTLMLGPLEDALAAGNRIPAEDRERLELAHCNSVRLLRLVNTLLDFSRIEAGRIEASYEETDIAKFTAELAAMFRSATERAGLRLFIDCPTVSEPAYVDREMWEKIVFNLLSNAFKFTFEGEIEVRLQQAGNLVELTVRDTGTGIPAEDLPHLFDRFYRVKGARGRTFEGSGIGLSLVQELAKLHGGSARVESELNRGSTFTVAIPLGKAHLRPQRIGAARTLESTGMRNQAYVDEALRWLQGSSSNFEDVQSFALSTAERRPTANTARILVADDNPDMRDYVQRLLGEHYEIETVNDGEAALRRARERRPALILSDIMMPRMDGFALVDAVRADESLRSIPVILLSARAGEESRIEGLESGADDYLVKPFSARELLVRVRSQLAMAKIRQQAATTEHKLRLDAELLAAIVTTSDDAIISKNLDGIISSWNHSAQRIFGYTAEEAIGKPIMLIIPEDRRDEEERIIAQLRRGERIEHFETVRVRKDGTPVDVALTISPVKDATGRVIGASKVARDITERKRTEERERQTNERAVAANAKFQAVFEQTRVFAGIMTKDGILVEANRPSLESSGYRAEEVLGKPFWETGWWAKFPQSRDKIRAATPLAAKGIPYQDTLHYSWADGTERLVDFALYPILDDQGQVLFLHPTGVDITDLKRTEENYRKLAETLDVEVRARTRELEERNTDVMRQAEQLRELSWQLLRAQDEERRHIARELHDSAGQTLTVLGMDLAALVQKTGRNSPELATRAEKIQETVRQLHRELRTTSYLLHPPLLDESGLSSALSWYVQGVIERSGLEITLDISPELGRLPNDMELVIFRLVQECLTNILRHSGSKTAEIRVTREPGSVTVEIKDQGKGVSATRLAEIQGKGSGVGIRGMRERLRQFGGNLEIESGDPGTRIFVKIPVASAAAEPQEGIEPLQAAV